MNKLKPISLDNGVTQIHPLRSSDLLRLDSITDNIFEILNDDQNTLYIPEKKVNDRQTVSNRLLGVTYRYEHQLGYTHFITLKANNEVLGLIDIFSPKGIETETNYGIENTWFIEYYLNKKVWGLGVMSNAVKAIVENMKMQGIDNIAAFCRPENIASTRILERTGFVNTGEFDQKQNLYKLIK